MVGKNNQYVKKIKQGTKVETYSIKKFKVGIASVAIGCSVFFGAGAVAMAGEQPVVTGTGAVSTSEGVAPKAEIGVTTVETATVTSRTTVQPQATSEKLNDTVNTTKLETLIKEVERLDLEKYTEESILGLKVRLAKAKDTLVNAKSQKEIDSAYNALVGYKNSGLKHVTKLEENNTLKLDTTEGKETVGKKAENTEPNGTNIAGHNHSLAGTTLPEGSRFRAGAKPELTDVQIGRWNGTRRTFDSSNVFVTPANYGVVGNVMKIKAISASDNFTNIEVTGNQGFPLKVKKNIKGKEAELYFEGNTPSNGSWNMTVTATTAKGTKTFNFGYYTALRKPTILTQNTALEGKAKEKPTIEVEVPTFSPAPTGAKFKVYLVRGGSTNGWDNSGNAYPSGYSVLASADVVASTGGKGTATINASNYRVSELGTTAFKAITVIELNGRENDTDPGERGSWFSEERKATEKLANKNELQAEIGRETETKAAAQYKNADQGKKAAYDQALTRAKEVMTNGAASQEEVNTAKRALEGARTALDGQATDKTALNTALSEETATKVSAAYYNATSEKQKTYNDAVAEGKKVLEKADATQTEVNDAVTAIANAKNALDGLETNKEVLVNAEGIEATTIKASGLYYNATKEAKKGYDEALVLGEKVLNKVDATQVEVDSALEVVNKAKDKLDGAPFPTDLEKAEAIKAVEAARTTKDQAIDINNDLTIEEKTEVKKQTQKEATDAISNINKATTNATVTTAKDNGIKVINAVSFPTKTVKSNAIEEVKKALDTKVKSIESSKEFTDNDKGILKDKAEKAAMVAIVEIKAATTNAAVETTKTEGIERINAVEARLAAKLEISELIITKWQDEAGNDLRPADAKAPSELGEANEALAHGVILGYEYVATKTDKENVVVTHIFRKLPKKDRTFSEKPKTSNLNKVEESQSPAKENVSVKSNLPNTGANTTNTGLAGLGLAMFGGLLTVARQRRRNK